jgi:hypothetical protein
MCAAPDSADADRMERALERLLEHCALVGRMTASTRRVAVKKRLERELGSELAGQLLSGLGSVAA